MEIEAIKETQIPILEFSKSDYLESVMNRKISGEDISILDEEWLAFSEILLNQIFSGDQFQELKRWCKRRFTKPGVVK